MSHRSEKSLRSIDLSALIGTVTSLAAFAAMGLLVHNLMWRPVDVDSLQKAGPEQPAQPATPSTPRKIVSQTSMAA